jgi:ABC-2 type transport system permease protein
MNAVSFSRSIKAIPEIVRVTLRQLLGRRRTLLLLLLSVVPVLMALVFVAAGESDVDGFATSVLDVFSVTILLPIVAVLFGTAAFGAEIEDGTVVYLLAKPISRWAVILAKLIGAAAVTALLTIASVAVAGVIALLPQGQHGVAAMIGFMAAMAVGSVCYVSFFLALSLYTRRALMIGIFYFLVWEGLLSSLLAGIANFSIRQYSLGAAGAFFQMSGQEARLTPGTALPLAAILVVVALTLATRKLMRFEMSGSGD